MPDSAARRRAATEFSLNLVVSASAGTGKTSLLVERVLNAVGSAHLALEQMAAVTFTRRAASEMRGRLAVGLEALRGLALSGAPARAGDRESEAGRSYAWLRGEKGIPAAALAARALEALEALDRFSVSTIHSFCAEILRLYPLEAGVDPGFGQDEGAHLEEVFEREWSGFLEAELGLEAARAPIWRRSLGLFSLGEMRQAARSLCDFGMPQPEQWRERCADPGRALAPLVRPILETADAILARARDLRPRFRDCLESVRLLAHAFLEGTWRGGEDGLPELSFDVLGRGETPAAGAGATGFDPEAAGDFVEAARGTLRALLDLREEEALAVIEPLREFVPRFRKAYLRSGWVSFDGLLALTRDLLSDHPNVRRALQERFRHLLVDEFQDTSPVQYEILFLLSGSAGAEPQRDAWKTRLEPGRLFIVGDPKQSIYRFLQADITAYGRAVDKIRAEGGELLRLTANFRSAAPLVGALNRVFGAEFPAAANDYQPEYHAMEATLPGEVDQARVEVWSTGPEPLKAPERRWAEARAIAAWIAEHAGEGRELRLSQVAILFRATTHMGLYLEELRAAGVPVVAEGGQEFLRRPEVRHLRALLRCLARPHDPVAVLAVLRSPLGAVSDGDLLGQARTGWGWSLLAQEPAESPLAVRRALSWLRALEAEARDLPAEEQVLLALERSGLELVEATHPDGAQGLANLRRYALAVAAAAREQALSLQQAIDVVEGRAGPGAAGLEESPLADETLEAVRVMTVHKAKGMEFDAVIVPDLCREEREGRQREMEVEWVRGENAGLALRTPRGVNAWRILHAHQEALHEEAEALRTFYVACTRARRRLILLAGPARRAAARQRWPAALRHWSGYDVARPPADGVALAPGVLHRDMAGARAARVAQPEAPSVRAAAERFERASAQARAAARIWDRRPSGLVESRWGREEAAEGPPAAHPVAPSVLVGRAIHLALESWEGRGEGGDVLSAAIRRCAREAGVEAGDLERGVAPVWEAIRRSSLPALLRGVDARGHEVPVLIDEGDGAVWSGSLDLLYRDADGTWVVADYKTEDPGCEAEAQARRYLPQLRVYARAVHRALGSLPRAEILWVRTGERTVFGPGELQGPLD